MKTPLVSRLLSLSVLLTALSATAFEPRTMICEWKGRPLVDPVWVDLMTGWVYELPAERQIVHSCGITFVEIPCYDSPCFLTERAALDMDGR